MIETDTQSLETIIKQGEQRAFETGKDQLVSYTEKISSMDPFIFFEGARLLKENRTFWKDAMDDFYIITVGEVFHITGKDESRYEHTFHKWRELRRHALLYNPYEEQEGTGIILTGGMSFDVKEEKTKLWERYPHSEFVVPKFSFVKKDQDYYLTTIILLSKENFLGSEDILNEINEKRKLLLKRDVAIPTGNEIIEKEEIKPELWKEKVQLAIDHIQNKQAEKIVMARELRVKLSKSAEITPILQRFLTLQRTSYLFAYERGDHCFVGATPERLVKVNGDKLLSTCLAGTAPRGKTPEEDLAIKESLFNDEKNRLEHDHVVQMIRRSINNYCTFLHIPEEPEVITLQDLQHLYTPVIGELKEEYSVFDIIRELHPTPALGGAPTGEALAFIRNHETFERGWYGSPVGWLDDRHNGEFAVAIRSGLIQDDEVSLFAGCGVMGDSDIQLEYEETGIKFLPMLTALEE